MTVRSIHDAFNVDDRAIVRFGAVFHKENFSKTLIIVAREYDRFGETLTSGYEAMVLNGEVVVTPGSGLPSTIQPPSEDDPTLNPPIREYRDFQWRATGGIHQYTDGDISGWEKAVNWIKNEENNLLSRGYVLVIQYEDPSPKPPSEEQVEGEEIERVSFGTLAYGPAKPSQGVMETYGYWVEGIASGFAASIIPIFMFGVALGSSIWAVNLGIKRIGGE